MLGANVHSGSSAARRLPADTGTKRERSEPRALTFDREIDVPELADEREMRDYPNRHIRLREPAIIAGDSGADAKENPLAYRLPNADTYERAAWRREVCPAAAIRSSQANEVDILRSNSGVRSQKDDRTSRSGSADSNGKIDAPQFATRLGEPELASVSACRARTERQISRYGGNALRAAVARGEDKRERDCGHPNASMKHVVAWCASESWCIETDPRRAR
ncbi:MAG TPA: hypothetical protein VGQ30_01790 [Gemmatimonadaceae bacterium]|jgi:hypothetical protein|nr:hypothetical protein [Gemmatimonadaceae bacterium]